MRTVITEDLRLADQRIKEWFLLEKARRERGEPAAAPAVLPTITLSRQYGAGGRTVAGKLAARLGGNWQIWDREIVDAVAESAQVRSEMIETLDERTRSWMDEILLYGLNVPLVETGAYREHLARVLLALVQQGNKIIVGRGAAFLLPDALNVRLRAGEPFCVKTTMQRENLSYEEAREKVRQVDRERAAFTRTLFGRDVDEASTYDMLLQIDRLGFDAAAAAIAAAVQIKFGDKTQ